jgi:hypothetical protein
LEVAEANGIIMLFPQANPVELVGTPAEGCWDTFGLGGPLYATKEGDQVRAVWRMIIRIIGGYGDGKYLPFKIRTLGSTSSQQTEIKL